VVLTALVVPLGCFMARVFDGERTFLSPVFRSPAFPKRIKFVGHGVHRRLIRCAFRVTANEGGAAATP
jgi:hypothetical protein